MTAILMWVLVAAVYMIQVSVIYRGWGIAAMLTTSLSGSLLWYCISQSSDNRYLDGVRYDLIIMMAYLLVPILMGWAPHLSNRAIVGLVLAVTGALIMKLG